MFNDPLSSIPDPIMWTVSTDGPPSQRQGKAKKSRRRRSMGREVADVPDNAFDWVGASIIGCIVAFAIMFLASLCYLAVAIHRDVSEFQQMEQQRKGHDATRED